MVGVKRWCSQRGLLAPVVAPLSPDRDAAGPNNHHPRRPSCRAALRVVLSRGRRVREHHDPAGIPRLVGRAGLRFVQRQSGHVAQRPRVPLPLPERMAPPVPQPRTVTVRVISCGRPFSDHLARMLIVPG